MEYPMEERCRLIKEACLQEQSTDPVLIFQHLADRDFIRIHGPEHHILDGACILTAFVQAGGKLDLEEALERLIREGLRMPGAACGLWGVCGAVTSIGAALAIIDGTGPLSTDGTWGEHMRFTSGALQRLAQMGGPRCCKRDAFASLSAAVSYLNDHYPVTLPLSGICCRYFPKNEQCIRERCPYYPKSL